MAGEKQLARGRRFDSFPRIQFAGVAQLVERRSCKSLVGGSRPPTSPTFVKMKHTSMNGDKTMKLFVMTILMTLFAVSIAPAKDFSLIGATPKAAKKVATTTASLTFKGSKASAKAAKKAVVVSVVSVGKFLF